MVMEYVNKLYSICAEAKRYRFEMALENVIERWSNRFDLTLKLTYPEMDTDDGVEDVPLYCEVFVRDVDGDFLDYYEIYSTEDVAKLDEDLRLLCAEEDWQKKVDEAVWSQSTEEQFETNNGEQNFSHSEILV